MLSLSKCSLLVLLIDGCILNFPALLNCAYVKVFIIVLYSFHLAPHNHTDAHEEAKGASRCQSNHRDHKEGLGLVGIVDTCKSSEDATDYRSHLEALEELGLSLACCSEDALHLSCQETVGFLFFFLILL